MKTLHNEVIIDAPLDRIWEYLAVTDKLDTYDPTVKRLLQPLPEKPALELVEK